MQRPRSVVLLIVWFLWATGNDLDSLARYATTADYYVFSNNGAAWLYFAASGSVFLLNAASVFYLLRPQPAGYPVLLSALIAGAVHNLGATALAVRDIAGVREAYEIGREVRGLAVRPEALDMIFSPSALWTSVGLALLVYVAIALLVRRNRTYFKGPAGYAAEA